MNLIFILNVILFILFNFWGIFGSLKDYVGSTQGYFELSGPYLEPTWAPGLTKICPGPIFGASLALYESKIGAKMDQLGATWSQLGPSWANLEPA